MIVTIERFFKPSSHNGVVTRRIRNLVRKVNYAVLKAVDISVPDWAESLNHIRMTQIVSRDGGFICCHLELPDSMPDSYVDRCMEEIKKIGKSHNLYVTVSETTVQ